jgi:glycosyltransferase involved in cell wall biosynthesis
LFSSTIIPTIGRSSLNRAVCSVLDQNNGRVDYEIIIVNDSGDPLSKQDWQDSPRVQIIETNRRNRSVARNTGAAAAKGIYLHFLDDDDWMLPGAFDDLRKLAQTNPDAGWVYGGARLVDNDSNTLIDVSPNFQGNCFIQAVAFEYIPLQASLIRVDAFFDAGGFAPLPLLLGGFEDVHLERVIASKREFAATPDVVAAIRMGESGSTTKWIGLFNQNRQSRELAIDITGAFSRMRDSAINSPSRKTYWYGQMIYYYLASVKWNIARRNLFKATSRLTFAFAGFLLSGSYILTSDFWRGLTSSHLNMIGSALLSVNARLHDPSKWNM